jgi:formylglycine-generating enzyme required for sulfatase activity
MHPNNIYATCDGFHYMGGIAKPDEWRHAMKKRRSAFLIMILSVLITACGTNGRAAEIGDTPDSSNEPSLLHVLLEGWVEAKPGLFLRNPNLDPTMIAMAVFEDTRLDQMEDNLQLLEPVEILESRGLQWELSRADLEIPEEGILVLELAVCQSDSAVYQVLFTVLSDEFDQLHDAVMEPVLRNFTASWIKDSQVDAGENPLTHQVSAPIDTRIRPADGMTMVYVPAGEFEMGHSGIQWMWNGNLADGDLGIQIYTDESPQHAVYLDAYWIDQTEVTVEMFRTFVEATGYRTSAEVDGCGAPYRAGPKEYEWPHLPGTDWQHPHGSDSIAQDDHPVVQVSWDDAATYCEWAGGGLPTEAQWEKAARGTDERLFPWGNSYEWNLGNFCDAQCPVERWKHEAFDDGYALTAPVGNFPGGSSAYGALDMAGNVWEWTADWYGEYYYGNSPYENPAGPRFGTERAQRGGAWLDSESWVRTTVRHATPPWVRCDDLGFRCALPAD